MVDTAVILAGGMATRLMPITARVPKSLVEVAGEPFISRQLALLESNGIRKAVLCVGHLGEQIQEVVGTGARWGVHVEYSFDGPTLQGTAGALRGAKRYLGDLFWVLYGDGYLDFDYRGVADFFARSGGEALGLMTVFANHNRWDRSNVVFRDGRLLKYDKWEQTPDMEYIDYGATLLRHDVLERIPPGPSDLADLYAGLVASGRMIGYEVTQRFYEIGSQEGLEEANRYFAAQDAGPHGRSSGRSHERAQPGLH